ncbi:MAG: hypothetical protein QXN97_06875 [Desulfurococcaceae archaeon]
MRQRFKTTKMPCKRSCHCRPGSGWRGPASSTWSACILGCCIPEKNIGVAKAYDLLVECPSREGSTRL